MELTSIERLTAENAEYFRCQLQVARENALKDAEAFEGIIHVIERLGSFCCNKISALGVYKDLLHELSLLSPLSKDIPDKFRNVHTPFDVLYDIVKDARNDAFHIGAYARHLTKHSTELALILEDALRMSHDSRLISDFMIPNPVCAKLWQPISLIRQQMLMNSFTYLPIVDNENNWCLISDYAIAKYLQCNSKTQRKERLAKQIKDTEIELFSANCVVTGLSIESIIEDFNGKPILVFEDESFDEISGILTAFDLL